MEGVVFGMMPCFDEFLESDYVPPGNYFVLWT